MVASAKKGENGMILKNKNAIITGCRRGIGRATLELFAKNGANVWACIRKQDDSFDAFIDSLMRMYNVRISPVYFDLADYEQIKNAVKQINAEKKNIDILVNNAGITYNALFQMTTMDKMEEVFRINYFSPLLFTQYISKIMVRQKRGNIINVASSAAIDANPGRSAYGASKAALICSSKAMAAELADKGIRVNVVAPGITNTDMVEESMSKEVIENTISETNLKRIGIPNDIAEAILFLSSDLSSYMTGQVLRVDGGM
jgi:3-oxoacyl-[acyl-carrier protein] reductase